MEIEKCKFAFSILQFPISNNLHRTEPLA